MGSLGLLLPLATGYCLVRLLWSDHAAPPPSRLWCASLSVVIGLGLGSCAYFAALLLSAGRIAVMGLDTLLVLGAAGAWLARRQTVRRETAPPWPARDVLLAAAVGVAILAGVAAFMANALAAPHGEWDAWAIWNIRARALARAGTGWPIAFDSSVMHADYPPLLPGVIAHAWTYQHDEPTAIPLALAAVFSLALVGLLGGAVARLRGRSQALAASLALLSTPALLRGASWQYADIPFAAFVLATLGVLAEAARPRAGGRGVLILAGAAAGFAAGTKNEGMLFLAALALAYAADHIARREPPDLGGLGAFAAGMLPSALLLAAFKLALAPPSYLLADQSFTDILARLVDPRRYAVIAAALAGELWHSLGPLLPIVVAYALLLGATGDPLARRLGARTALVVALMAAGYAGVYALTPLDLSWQLAHSLDRLILHAWPSALLAVFLLLASPEERLVARPSSSAAQRNRRPVRSSRAAVAR